MKLENILKELKTECFFKEVFDEGINNPGQQPYIDYPRKIVHVRADHDGHRWWNTFWSSHSELAAPAIRNGLSTLFWFFPISVDL